MQKRITLASNDAGISNESSRYRSHVRERTVRDENEVLMDAATIVDARAFPTRGDGALSKDIGDEL